MSEPDRFSPLRILRWHGRISHIVLGNGIRGPIRAAIDLTNLCNDFCPWCEPLKYRKESIADRRHTLSTDVVFAVLEDLKILSCKTINFSGGGEPLLHPDFGPILKYAARRGFTTWIVTNGRYIDKWMEALRFASHVRVSLDASTDEEHMEMHGSKTGEFGQTLANIEMLCNAKKKWGDGPEVGISYLVADCNDYTSSYERILEFATGAGVDFIHFRPLSEDSPKRFTSQWDEEDAGAATQIKAIAEKYPAVKVYVVGKRHRDVFSQRDFKKCYASLITAVIGASGDLQACCDERGKVYGNVNEQSFRSLWLSAAHRKMAAAITPALCQRCLMCSVNKSVEKYVVGNDALPELV